MMTLTTTEQLNILNELISDAQFELNALLKSLGQTQKTIDVLQVKIAAYDFAKKDAPAELKAELDEAKSQFEAGQAQVETLRQNVDMYEDYRDSLLGA